MSHITRRRFLAAGGAAVATVLLPLKVAFERTVGRNTHYTMSEAEADAVTQEIRNTSVVRKLTYVQFHGISLVDYADCVNPHTLLRRT